MNREKKTAQTMNVTRTAYSLESGTESTSSQEEELEDWIEYIKRSEREAGEKMLTYKHHKLGRETEEKEMPPSPAKYHTEPRMVDQKSCRVEPKGKQKHQPMERRIE